MDNQKLNVKPHNGYGFIYCYTSPSGKKYIGQTKTTLKERAKKNAKGYKGCKAFYNAIQKYGWDNFEIEILAEVPYSYMNETETQYILFFDTINPAKGYNIMTDNISYLYGLNRIPVYSYYADTGLFAESYDSIAAAERLNGVFHGSIRRILNDKKHTVKGKIWLTEKQNFIEPLLREPQASCKKVYMYDSQTGDLIKEFSSIREAGRESGYNRWTIQEHTSRNNVVKGKKHTFKNFKVDNLYNVSSTTIPSGVDLNNSK